MNANQLTNSLTIYQDDLVTIRRESTPDGGTTRYHVEWLACDDPVIVCDRESFDTKSQALAALAQWQLEYEERLERNKQPPQKNEPAQLRYPVDR
jgi:hypothetical protein